MIKLPMFSALIPVYYKENPDYLYKCLQSIAEQTVQPDEIVIVKDGPLTPELDAVLDQYRYLNFTIIQFEKNMGLGTALNEGVKKCKYDLIARMDSDDIAVPNRFELQLNAFAQHPEYDIIGGQITEFEREITNLINKRIVPISHTEILKFTKRRNPFNHVTVMFKKNSVINAGNYIPCDLAEDYYLWVRMFVIGCKAHNLPETLVYVRAGNVMYLRRGGIAYSRKIFNLQRLIFKTGFINVFEFFLTTAIKCLVAVLPNQLRGYIYKTLLRK